jgi:lipid II:glycine glycyltransferase (peptidoglycan interpeptide bridge formation enzyme)
LNKVTLEIITNQNEWNDILKEIGVYDFYHTFDYHIIEALGNQTPMLLKYTENDVLIALPLLIRKIENTNYFDATSVYGYVGPISKGLDSNFDNKLFLRELSDYFIKNNVVSVFSRLNPYINHQRTILKNLGELINQGKVVNIDLKLDEITQKANYQKRIRSHINKARKNCVIKNGTSKSDLKEFMTIYYENMEHVKAEKYYYFNEDYFNKIMGSNNFNAELLLVKDLNSGITIAGSLFITTNKIVQYHLSGCKREFLYLNPVKLLIDEMRVIAMQRELKFFNLGGGLGGNDEDSLFRFKLSFSKDFRDFDLWKLIVNQKIYNQLVEDKNINAVTSYFPKYRYLEDN